MNKINTPPYSTFPTVSNEKILLRQIQNSDINDLIEISYYDAIQATTLEQAIEMNSKINADYDKGDSIHWGIIDNQSNKIVGTCGFYRGFNKDEGELGCVLLPQYRGQGFMTSAMLLAIDFGLNDIGLKRIMAITSQQNQKAIRLLERVGFIQIKFLTDNDNDIEFELPSKTKQ
ncbi:GCN5-related N-acetyltransferase [Flavobacterium cauense R2A-7]|uniref:Ribosomal-protein-alanine N-acetyltransferase n=1 Tax=Flavobacterium cauense R2A-7 TaxID=1341154 RepID=V6RXW7_9FLAO|nr:GNAT family protein [Flavobacterium cauense]ESU19009.1 GCN5-related N-acetyltransferase [Flavobacterium cauense R2A-7]KGO82361.1 GCN5 family acetyltransferase [Flavobacterium cauense R2A-7]TWI15328.1 ribosomal-protein-alanine N-acetyltransferase [Flavobacterium cauense R2A-7]